MRDLWRKPNFVCEQAKGKVHAKRCCKDRALKKQKPILQATVSLTITETEGSHLLEILRYLQNFISAELIDGFSSQII
jgi:hypothetical protein